MPVEQQCARFGRVVVAGADGPPPDVLVEAFADDGFAVESVESGGDGVVGLCCFDVGESAAPALVESVRALRRRCGAVALVGTGLTACPTWPTRIADAARVLDPDGVLPVFALALDVAARGERPASGLPELLDWVGEESDARAGAELSRRATAERLSGLRVGSAAVRSWAGGHIHGAFREVAFQAQDAAASLRARDVPAYTGWLRQCCAAVEQRLVVGVAEQAAHLQAVALVGLRAYDPVDDPRPAAPPAAAPQWPRRAWGAEDAVLVLIGASSGLGVGRLVAGSLSGWISPWTAVALAVVLGVSVAAGAVALRRRVLLRAQARSWAGEVIADARARTEWRVAGMLNAVEPTATARIRRAVAS
ncbi:hypothetical protein nbrc107697_01830 [Gordonia crocea]|uniref:Uncharacterized protein n=2 Tax=Gordonia crocea TaxID=589162 RepID=A0A7M3SU20_9ACTN|nr:hypothetical protein nbrc107697_01830 [Gordonia crocea]